MTKHVRRPLRTAVPCRTYCACHCATGTWHAHVSAQGNRPACNRPTVPPINNMHATVWCNTTPIGQMRAKPVDAKTPCACCVPTV